MSKSQKEREETVQLCVSSEQIRHLYPGDHQALSGLLVACEYFLTTTLLPEILVQSSVTVLTVCSGAQRWSLVSTSAGARFALFSGGGATAKPMLAGVDQFSQR